MGATDPKGTVACSRSSEGFRERLQERVRWELDEAKAGRRRLISRAAAAAFLGVSTKTLQRWRHGAPGGPDCASAPRVGDGGGVNTHVKYDYTCLDRWVSTAHRTGSILQAQAVWQMPKTAPGPVLAFATLADVAAVEHPWVVQGGEVLGHGYTVPDDILAAAIDADDIEAWTVEEALTVERWGDGAGRGLFLAAVDAALAAARERLGVSDTAQTLDDLLPPADTLPKRSGPRKL